MGKFEAQVAPSTKKKVVDLYRKGAKVGDIVDETGVARSSVYWILRDQGVQVRQKSGPKPSGAVDAVHQETLDALHEVIESQRAKIIELAEEVGLLKAQLKAGR
jgi:orotate phosphoribosyltransferase-like protein